MIHGDTNIDRHALAASGFDFKGPADKGRTLAHTYQTQTLTDLTFSRVFSRFDPGPIVFYYQRYSRIALLEQNRNIFCVSVFQYIV